MPLATARMFAELTVMAMPQPYRSPAQARLELTETAMPYQFAENAGLYGI